MAQQVGGRVASAANEKPALLTRRVAQLAARPISRHCADRHAERYEVRCDGDIVFTAKTRREAQEYIQRVKRPGERIDHDEWVDGVGCVDRGVLEMDWNSPEERLALLDRVGVKQYNLPRRQAALAERIPTRIYGATTDELE